MATKHGSVTETESMPSSSLGGVPRSGVEVLLEKGLRLQLFRSLTRIERHLCRRDPQALSLIRAWYSGGAAAGAGGGADVTDAPEHTESVKLSKERRRRRRQSHRRMEQNEIDNAALKYLKIPKGIAARGLLVPPQPAWVFSEAAPPPAFPEDADVAGFSWLVNSNVSNAEDSSRRSLEREMMKQKLDQWVFLFFRVLKRNWESTVVEEKKAAADVNMYAEENLSKWTVKFRFKIMRRVPVKVALSAFMSRLGLETNASVVFCRDGFYGLMDVGNAYGNITKTPSTLISFSSTPRYLGLKNGDSIFVNSCSDTQRHLMEEAPRQDAPKRVALDINEEGEFDGAAEDGSMYDDEDIYFDNMNA